MWKSKRSLQIGGVFLLFTLALGFFREYLFKSVNFYIKKEYYNLDFETDDPLYSFLSHFNYSDLMKIKWVLTIVFILLFYSLSVLILKTFFKESKVVIKLLTLGSVLLFIIGSLFYLAKGLFPHPDTGYILSRRFIGVLQSPVPLMVVSAVHLMFYNLKGSVIEK